MTSCAYMCGQFSNLKFLPDPGALDACMHSRPVKYAGFTMVQNMARCNYLDMGFETLDLKSCEL